MRAQTALESAAQQTITTTVLRKFAATARQRMRIEGGGYRRDHLRALAHSVEVADREVRIMGSKSDLLRRLTAISGVKSATGGVRSSVLDWRRECLHKSRNWQGISIDCESVPFCTRKLTHEESADCSNRSRTPADGPSHCR